MVGVTSWAGELAAVKLAVALPQRWAHVRAVAAKAENLRLILGEEADLLVAAAWLHDIGYAPSVEQTKFHPLDGARYVRGLGADLRLCGLVANHSGARHEAVLRDLDAELAEFPDEDSLTRDCLWCCDMTTSPTGRPVTFDQRIAEIRERYGDEHSVTRAIESAADEVRMAIGNVQRQIAAFGLAAC